MRISPSRPDLGCRHQPQPKQRRKQEQVEISTGAFKLDSPTHTGTIYTISISIQSPDKLDKYTKPGNTSNCIKYVINRTETETDEIFTVAADIFKCHWGMLQLQSVSRYIHRAMDTKSDTIFGSVFSVYVFLGFIVWALMFLK